MRRIPVDLSGLPMHRSARTTIPCAREEHHAVTEKAVASGAADQPPRQMIEWYCTVLGAEVLYQNKQIAFISYDDEHHRVAFVDPGPFADKAPAEGKTARAGGEVGLHHVAFTMGSIRRAGRPVPHLKDQGIRRTAASTTASRPRCTTTIPTATRSSCWSTISRPRSKARTTCAAARPPTRTRSASTSIPEEMVKRIHNGLNLEELQTINA